MNLLEFYEQDPEGYRSEKEDNTAFKLDEPRKRRSSLTLEKLNRLRVMNDSRRAEHEEKLKTISTQYKPPAPEGGGMPGL